MCDSKLGKRHLLFPPTPFPTCLQIVETFRNMHHPDLCQIIILTQMSQQHRFGFPKTILNMLVTSENFKTYLVFADCIQEHSLFKVHFSLICGCSFLNARLQPDQSSHNPSCFCTSKCFCSKSDLGFKYLSLTIFTYPNSASLSSSFSSVCCSPQIQGLSSLNFLSTFFFSPPHHTFFVLIDLITQVLDYKGIPSLISNTYHSFWRVVKFNKFHSILFVKTFFLSHYAVSEVQIIIF